MLVCVTQLPAFRFKFCCNTKLVEGTSQDKARLLLEGVRFNRGAGVEYEVYTAPGLVFGGVPV